MVKGNYSDYYITSQSLKKKKKIRFHIFLDFGILQPKVSFKDAFSTEKRPKSTLSTFRRTLFSPITTSSCETQNEPQKSNSPESSNFPKTTSVPPPVTLTCSLRTAGSSKINGHDYDDDEISDRDIFLIVVAIDGRSDLHQVLFPCPPARLALRARSHARVRRVFL